jgi:hypothetical protein
MSARCDLLTGYYLKNGRPHPGLRLTSLNVDQKAGLKLKQRISLVGKISTDKKKERSREFA